MEHKAANTNQEISEISNGEDGGVTMLPAAFDAFVGKV
jgi:hypothetical protein